MQRRVVGGGGNQDPVVADVGDGESGVANEKLVVAVVLVVVVDVVAVGVAGERKVQAAVAEPSGRCGLVGGVGDVVGGEVGQVQGLDRIVEVTDEECWLCCFVVVADV